MQREHAQLTTQARAATVVAWEVLMGRSQFNLRAFPASLTDATSFYRSLGPLSALRHSKPGLSVQVANEVDWVAMALADAIMLQRPCRSSQVQIAEMAAKHGVPVWVEHDDDIFSLPSDNPHHDQYMNPGVHAAAAKIANLADIVTVSTQALAERFAKFTRQPPIVVPNALMTNMVGHVPDHADKPRMNAVMWRGSITHQRDLDLYTDAMARVAAQNPDTAWLFQGIGANNYRVLEVITKSQRGHQADPIDYFNILASTRPKVMVVPLVDNAFNRAKSNIAWIEAIYAGAVCVAPDWPEWRRPGCFNYASTEAFPEVLNAAINLSDKTRNEHWRAGRDFVNGELAIDVVNQKRVAIMDLLSNMSESRDWRAGRRAAYFDRLVRATPI